MQEINIVAKIVTDYEGLSAAGRSLVDRLVIGPERYLVTRHSGGTSTKKRMRRGATPTEQQATPVQRKSRGGRPRKQPTQQPTT